MGIVSDDELLADLINSDTKPIIINNNDTKLINNAEIIDEPTNGRNKGDNNVPSALRALISETAQLDGRSDALEFANKFGISNSSVSAYTKEVNSTNQFNNNKKPEIKNHVDRIKRNISKKARTVLREALDNITTEKLIEAKAIDCANIAKSMSSIVNDMTPPVVNTDDKNNVPQIIIYAPQMRTENSFEYIDARD